MTLHFTPLGKPHIAQVDSYKGEPESGSRDKFSVPDGFEPVTQA